MTRQSAEEVPGSKNTLCDAIMMATGHFMFVKARRVNPNVNFVL